MADSQSRLSRLVGTNKELEKLIALNGEKFRELEKQAIELELKLRQANDEIFSLHTQLNKIKLSRSWKLFLLLTYPIRISKRKFRKLINLS